MHKGVFRITRLRVQLLHRHCLFHKVSSCLQKNIILHLQVHTCSKCIISKKVLNSSASSRMQWDDKFIATRIIRHVPVVSTTYVRQKVRFSLTLFLSKLIKWASNKNNLVFYSVPTNVKIAAAAVCACKMEACLHPQKCLE